MVVTRSTAAERKDDVLDAAMIEFAEKGYDGTSTDDIAKRAGISQPYLFRLFGTKKELFKATVSRCFRETLEMFQRAAEGKRGEEALQAIGRRTWNSCRPTGRGSARRCRRTRPPPTTPRSARSCGPATATSSRTRAASPDADGEQLWQFFATGMLFNVLASMHVNDSPEQWMLDLLAGCGKEL